MTLAPVDKPTLVIPPVAAALSGIPVALRATPADELRREVLKMLG